MPTEKILFTSVRAAAPTGRIPTLGSSTENFTSSASTMGSLASPDPSSSSYNLYIHDIINTALHNNDIAEQDVDCEILPEVGDVNQPGEKINVYVCTYCLSHRQKGIFILINNIPFCLVPSNSPDELQSSHSRAMRSIIGTSVELKRYDKLLISLKKGGTRNQPEERKIHDKLLASLQTKVLAAYNSLAAQHTDLEKRSLQGSGTLPVSAQYNEYTRTLKRCKVLLCHWNITF